MRIKTESQLKMFDEAIAQCEGNVQLIDAITGKEYNLKNPGDKAEAFAKLPLDEQESLELFVNLRYDQEVMIGFMGRLDRGESAEESIKRIAFDHCAFQVSNLENSIRFYREKLGFNLLFRTKAEEYGEFGAYLDLNGMRLELTQSTESEFVPRSPRKPFCPHVCFSVDDLDKYVSILHCSDVEILDGPNEVPGSDRWIYFADPDQNVLEFVCWEDLSRAKS